jgi:ABC-type transporter Mla MlaB component
MSPAGTIAFAVGGRLTRAELPGLCSRVARCLAARAPAVALCDVSGAAADAVTVDALARLRLTARRHGCELRFHGASAELLALVDYVGLSDALRP